MTDAQPPDLRIGDAERTDALRALDEHFTGGRLDVDEYSERSARATAARTRGQLAELFADLPQPHPGFAPAPLAKVEQAPAARARSGGMTRAERLGGALVPLSVIVAFVLFFTTGVPWVIFLLPAAVAVIAGSLQGSDKRRERGRDRDRRRR